MAISFKNVTNAKIMLLGLELIVRTFVQCYSLIHNSITIFETNLEQYGLDAKPQNLSSILQSSVAFLVMNQHSVRIYASNELYKTHPFLTVKSAISTNFPLSFNLKPSLKSQSVTYLGKLNAQINIQCSYIFHTCLMRNLSFQDYLSCLTDGKM